MKYIYIRTTVEQKLDAHKNPSPHLDLVYKSKSTGGLIKKIMFCE